MYSAEELKKLARVAWHTDDDELLFSKEKRLSALRSQADNKLKRSAAAIELQRHWRGYIARSNWLNVVNSRTNLHWKNDPHTDDSVLPSYHGATSMFPSASSSSEISSCIGSNKAYTSYAAIYQTNRPRPFIEFCCTIIQRWWRLILAKRRHRDYMLASADYAEHFGFKMWKPTDIRKLETAARIIQRAWRRHVDTEVFKYYKEFVCTKFECNPAHFLKSINPRESQLFDPASGLFIRFRLGGETFPPSVYYKVFTTRNIADVGAFAPRDYTEPLLKMLPMKYLHNKSSLTNSETSVDCNPGWYQRMDNNGWRLVSDKVLGRLYHDDISYSSSIKRSQFHHSKLLRKSACEKARKQKKINWMKKMYRDGAANMGDERIQTLIDSTAKGIMAASETGYEVSVEDWEVDELLIWTNALNFDQYLSTWKDLGTTTSSNPAGENNR